MATVRMHGSKAAMPTQVQKVSGKAPSKHTFTIVMEKDEDGFWAVRVPALPGCFTQGRTKAEAKANAREAIACHLDAFASEVEVRPEEVVVERVRRAVG